MHMMSRHIELTVGWAETPHEVDVVVIGDRAVPRLIHVTFPGAGGQPSLNFTIDSSSGVPRCTRLSMETVEGGREVRTTDLRAIELANWIEKIVPLFSGQARHEDGHLHVAFAHGLKSEGEARDVVRQLRRAQRADRRKFDDDFLRKVADTYRSDPVRLAQAVELAFDVSIRTAHRYIGAARERGLLAGKDGK